MNNVEKSIQKRIDDILLAEQEKWATRERSGKFSPSSFGGCFRKQIFNRRNEPKSNPSDARSLRIFKVGNLFHDFLKNIVAGDNTEILLEQMVEADDILGFADVVTENEVIEIKSQHSRAFWYMHKPENDIKKEKPDHILQATCYAVLLGKEFIRLVYISKDDLCIEEYVFKVTEELVANFNDELIILRKFWVREELPPPMPRLYVDKKTGLSKECQYCSWMDTCFKLQGKPVKDE